MALGESVGNTTGNKVKSFFTTCGKYLTPLIVGIVVGLLINLPKCSGDPKVVVEYIEKYDTVTVEKERIVEKTKIKYIDRIDTFYVKESGDTVTVQDLPIEHKVYEDTIKNDSTSTEIKIEYSGFNAEINDIWLKHNYVEKQITITKEKKVGWVWYVGIDGGIGLHLDIPTKNLGWGPQVGLHAGVGIGGTIK